MDDKKRAQAINRHIKWDELFEAADIVAGCVDYRGRPILERYGTEPRMLAGMAYMMGVAEGKRRERARKRREV